MLGKRLLLLVAPRRRFAAALRGSALVCALLCAACDAYDASLLRAPSPEQPPAHDAGSKPPPDKDAGQHAQDAGDDAGMTVCIKTDEICNGKDDDCDGKTDETTQAYCESVILNADTTCATAAGRCVKLQCHKGFWDCDGKPQNGCEKPFCACNDCSDAGSERDGG